MNTSVTPVFAVRTADYRYPDGTYALRGVNFAARAGDALAVLGANGSGKSTLLRLLDGLAVATEGEVVAFGERLEPRRLENENWAYSFRRRVGFVFQNADAQLFCATVGDELRFGPVQLGWPQDRVEKRARELAMLFELEGLLDRPPHRLSGGEKRRVALAAVMAVDPEVLLLDEPTGGLDPRSQEWLADFLARLRDEGRTLVVATHDLELAARVARRALVLDEGHRVAADGAVGAVLTDRKLLLAVNLIHEHFHRHDGGVVHAHEHAHGGEHEHEHEHEHDREHEHQREDDHHLHQREHGHDDREQAF